MKSLTFFQNSISIFAIVMLAVVSTLSVMALSPIATNNSTSQVAGLNTETDPEILSNREDLVIEDKAPQSVTYKTQLVKLDSTHYQFTATANKQKQTTSERPFIQIKNPNSASVKVKFSSQIAQFITDSVHVSIVTADETIRVHDANRPTAGRTAEFEIPAKGSLELSIRYEYLRAVAFESEVVVNLEVI